MSIFAAAGREAGQLGRLSWILVLAAVGVWCIVVAVMLTAVRRRGSGDDSVDLTQPGHRPLVVGGLLIPGMILIALFVTSMLTMRPLSGRDAQPAVTYRVIGHQWWWDVEYVGPDAGSFHTANEIHVPLGKSVRLVLIAADVIHSFWVPQLQGKRDLIPGDTNVLAFTATMPGVFRGQCAEYCGLQHAHMGFTVVVDSVPQFEAWLASQRADAPVPAAPSDSSGVMLATQGACASCHTIRGTAARGTLGPDLTHVASRQRLGSGILPNDLATLEAWIRDPHAFKPGVVMPAFSQLPPAELHEVALYLAGLH
jgi:cytochrome c oxidase subunit II